MKKGYSKNFWFGQPSTFNCICVCVTFNDRLTLSLQDSVKMNERTNRYIKFLLLTITKSSHEVNFPFHWLSHWGWSASIWSASPHGAENAMLADWFKMNAWWWQIIQAYLSFGMLACTNHLWYIVYLNQYYFLGCVQNKSWILQCHWAFRTFKVWRKWIILLSCINLSIRYRYYRSFVY